MLSGAGRLAATPFAHTSIVSDFDFVVVYGVTNQLTTCIHQSVKYSLATVCGCVSFV